MRPLIFAHRGASGDAPENTMTAFRLALEQGADGIELDVQRTADRKLVVIHDETLERTTDGKGLVATKTYKELSQMNAAAHFGNGYGGEPIPLLEEVLAWIAPTSLLLNIELKNGILPYEGMEEEVVELVRHYGLNNRVILSSFNHYSLVTLGRIAPEMERAILYVAGLYEPWEYAGRVGATSLHPYFYNAVQEIIQGTKRAGMKIRPWTVDREGDLSRMISLGVDGIITNYPARTKKILMSV
ncbi:MAG: glycerophosphodiester phosphodiesterase [Thermicanus sp.]|nr:glycerophosphodiester phosphodiesterase [Thermicanus sp.]